MKLEDKLIKLRKDHAWSQEELAERMEVTRQTISKWELGQTVPDTANLSKLASIFGISVNDLLNEDANLKNDNYEHKGKSRKTIVMVILVIILIAAILGIGVTISNKSNSNSDSSTSSNNSASAFGVFSNFFSNFFSIFSDTYNEMEEMQDDYNNSVQQMQEQYNNAVQQMEESSAKSEFNSSFEVHYNGSVYGVWMSDLLGDVITSNTKNPSHIISVKYGDIETSDSDEIKAIKNKLDNTMNTKYLVSYEYDEDGYINKAIIEDF